MLWNFTMNKKESKDEQIIDIKDIQYLSKTKYQNYLHLTERTIFCEHDNFICTYITKNNTLLNLYLALKNNSTGEGYIYDNNNKYYIKAHSQFISKLLFDYNHNYLISCSYDKYIKIWDLLKKDVNKKCINQLKGHKGRIYDMDLINDKNKLLSCGMDKNIIIWDLNTFSLYKKILINSCFHNIIIKYISTFENTIDNISKEFFLLYSKNGIINIIDINNSKIIETINIFINDGTVLFINNQECLFQNNKTFNLVVYDFKNKKKTGELIGCNYNVLLMYKIDKINKIISFDKGNNIKIWNYIKKICELNIKIEFIMHCLYVDNEGNLFCGSLNKTFKYN